MVDPSALLFKRVLEAQVILSESVAGMACIAGLSDDHNRAKAEKAAAIGAKYLAAITILEEMQLDPVPFPLETVTITT